MSDNTTTTDEFIEIQREYYSSMTEALTEAKGATLKRRKMGNLLFNTATVLFTIIAVMYLFVAIGGSPLYFILALVWLGLAALEFFYLKPTAISVTDSLLRSYDAELENVRECSEEFERNAEMFKRA